ncbi:pyridoxamine 5'-phosphate oxidase family protein [Rhizobium sp. ARZ01]|uniref:pyridoxamine 5'-phosphate oxidase family protein n=1 Tax=Rhizobium sp. ARZ01 TaxID=2769313 RepID=UPI001786B147|nr:pyridoxamine 5'-phosphate oxidase family protein [Rhizobium sp. ARZ01]MBD9373437.1 pyridoxamine 5'-phosphate oxidase family protein [Rhizobium sp. ARZ01]
MASLSKARQNPKEQLFDEIDRIDAGMLGLETIRMHMQPMAPHLDRETNTIWFFTKSDTDLADAIGEGARAHFCVVGKDHDYHACLAGPIAVDKDHTKIDEYWNSVVEAWFDHGKDDPTLTMLAMRLDDAAIWASTGNTLKFGWEIAKANFSAGEEPDVGVRTHVVFEKTADEQRQWLS